MDTINMRILELIIEQRIRERRAEIERVQPLRVASRPPPSLRHRLASTLVRWGLRIDPAAGERLREANAAFSKQNVREPV